MRKDTINTRNKIIATAERLYADRGIEAVSLNEITREAEQKNKSALSYHFGDKDGLLQAIIAKHVGSVLEERTTLVAQLQSANNLTLETLTQSIVYSLASKLDDDNGGRYYLSILAQLISANRYDLLWEEMDYMTGNEAVMDLYAEFTADTPEELRMPRLMQACHMLFHSLAYIAKVVDSKQGVTSLKDNQRIVHVFTENLVDSLVAIARVRPSEATQFSMAEAV